MKERKWKKRQKNSNIERHIALKDKKVEKLNCLK